MLLLTSFMLNPLGLLLYISASISSRRVFSCATVFFGLAVSIIPLRKPQEMFACLPVLAIGWVGILLWLIRPGLKCVNEVLFCLSIAIPALLYAHVFVKYQVL